MEKAKRHYPHYENEQLCEINNELKKANNELRIENRKLKAKIIKQEVYKLQRLTALCRLRKLRG
jgi:hypothetical protein